VKAGADLVCFSGDKMLGGPQCGIIVGRRELIERIKKNPLTRALRCDKMTYAAAEATLKLFLEPEKMITTHPVLSMIARKPESVQGQARRLRRRLLSQLSGKAELAVIPGETEMGSGSLPGKSIPTFLLQIKPLSLMPDELGKRLRLGNPPVFTRIAADAVLLDLRTVFEEEERTLASCLVAAF
jgi:L-seryl-tRNA(Ser) seleniumtransferase